MIVFCLCKETLKVLNNANNKVSNTFNFIINSDQ